MGQKHLMDASSSSDKPPDLAAMIQGLGQRLEPGTKKEVRDAHRKSKQSQTSDEDCKLPPSERCGKCGSAECFLDQKQCADNESLTIAQALVHGWLNVDSLWTENETLSSQDRDCL